MATQRMSVFVLICESCVLESIIHLLCLYFSSVCFYVLHQSMLGNSDYFLASFFMLTLSDIKQEPAAQLDLIYSAWRDNN